MAKRIKFYIGRCSPLHNGHCSVMLHAMKDCDLFIVLLGSSERSRSLRNPFTFNERKDMITQWLSSANIDNMPKVVISSLRDYPHNDTLWFYQVQSVIEDTVKSVFGSEEVNITIVGSDRDDTTWYLHAFPQWDKELVSTVRIPGIDDLSATLVREALFSDDLKSISLGVPASTMRFLSEFKKTPEYVVLQHWFFQNEAYKKAWEVAPYPPIFVTVDSVVVQSGHVLVVERGANPGEGLWALPGGFVKQRQRLRDAAVAEIIEETGLTLGTGKAARANTEQTLKNKICVSEVFDDPNRSERGRTITHVFGIKLDDSKDLPFVKGQNVPIEDVAFNLSATYRKLSITSQNPRTSSDDVQSAKWMMKEIEKSYENQHIVETSKAMWLPFSVALSSPTNWFEDHHSILETVLNKMSNKA